MRQREHCAVYWARNAHPRSEMGAADAKGVHNVCNKRGRARSQLSRRGRGREAEEQHGERDCVLWPVRVEVSVQGFHVNVQGWEWGGAPRHWRANGWACPWGQ